MNRVVWIRRGILLLGLACGCAAVPTEERRGRSSERTERAREPAAVERTPARRPAEKAAGEEAPSPRPHRARIATEEPAGEARSGDPEGAGNAETGRAEDGGPQPDAAAVVDSSGTPPPPAEREDLEPQRGERPAEQATGPIGTRPLAPPSPPDFLLSFESRYSRIEIPVDVPTPAAECDVAGKGVVEGISLALVRYAPSISIHERIITAPEGESGFLALHVTLRTPVQHHETWLVPGSRVFGRATFPAARIECLPRQSPEQLASTRDLLRELQGAGAKLLFEVKSDGRRRLFPAREGETIRIADPEYTVTVERIFGNFTLDPRTGQAHDVGSRPFNPAVQARIERRGRTRTAWLFSQLPEFSREAEDDDAIFSLVYPVSDHPHQRAEITVVDGGSGPSTVFLGRGGELHERTVTSPGVARLGGVTVGIPERITNARIRQVVQADPGGRPAVLVAWRGAAREGTRWIPLGTELELRTRDAVLIARLRPGAPGAPERSPHGGGASTPAGHPKVHERR